MNIDDLEWKSIPNATSITFTTIWKDELVGWIEIYDWCDHNFHPESWHFWYEREHDHLTYVNVVAIFFEFYNDEDALAFTLRWT